MFFKILIGRFFMTPCNIVVLDGLFAKDIVSESFVKLNCRDGDVVTEDVAKKLLKSNKRERCPVCFTAVSNYKTVDDVTSASVNKSSKKNLCEKLFKSFSS